VLGRLYTYLDIWVGRVINNKLLSLVLYDLSCPIDVIGFMLSLHACYAYTHHMAFDACFLIQIYRYTFTYLCTLLGIHLATRWRDSDSPGLACSGSEVWIEVELSAKD